MKHYTVTIQTTGYVTYEVKAESEDDIRDLIEAGKGKLIEEATGDWDETQEWEIEATAE